MMRGSLAEKLRVLRAQRGLTLVQASQETGVDRGTLSSLERGVHAAYTPTLSRIARGYGVPVEELLEEPVLAGKAEAPSASPSPDGEPGETGQEEERREEEEFAAARRYLIPLMDSYTRIFSDLTEGHGTRIANLSEELPAERVLMVYQWVSEFLSTCDLIEHALLEKGVMEAAISLIDREQAEEGSVPSDLLQRARIFQRTWTELFVDTWTAANDWVQAQVARPEVMEHAAREKRKADKRQEKASNVVDMASWKQKPKKEGASAWDTHAGHTG